MKINNDQLKINPLLQELYTNSLICEGMTRCSMCKDCNRIVIECISLEDYKKENEQEINNANG